MSSPQYAYVDVLPTLSKREKQILILIAEEYTTAEIADSLHISEHTVKSHRKNLIEKLKVRGLAGLVRIACKNGLVDA